MVHDGRLRRDLRGGGGERAELGGALRRHGARPDRDPRGWQYDGVSFGDGSLLSRRAADWTVLGAERRTKTWFS